MMRLTTDMWPMSFCASIFVNLLTNQQGKRRKRGPEKQSVSETGNPGNFKRRDYGVWCTVYCSLPRLPVDMPIIIIKKNFDLLADDLRNLKMTGHFDVIFSRFSFDAPTTAFPFHASARKGDWDAMY
eukprot:scaffold5631_cov167-Amphora_coffeaeformis.AAC.4